MCAREPWRSDALQRGDGALITALTRRYRQPPGEEAALAALEGVGELEHLHRSHEPFRRDRKSLCEECPALGVIALSAHDDHLRGAQT